MYLFSLLSLLNILIYLSLVIFGFVFGTTVMREMKQKNVHLKEISEVLRRNDSIEKIEEEK